MKSRYNHFVFKHSRNVRNGNHLGDDLIGFYNLYGEETGAQISEINCPRP